MDEYGWDSSEEEMSVNSGPRSNMKDYLQMMDKELSKTEMGKSFEKVSFILVFLLFWKTTDF